MNKCILLGTDWIVSAAFPGCTSTRAGGVDETAAVPRLYGSYLYGSNSGYMQYVLQVLKTRTDCSPVGLKLCV
mgnify:CR=1 FL=1